MDGSLKINTAKMILAYLGMTHEELMDWDYLARYEFYYFAAFDVKISYASEGYYIKSYPRDASGNMRNFLRYVRAVRKSKKEFASEKERTINEYAWVKKNTTKFGDWLK